jgi:hypothetical protein
VTRRIFIGALAGIAAPKNHLVLEAIAAERMPHRLIVRGLTRAPFFEMRDYGNATPELGDLQPVLEENGKLLFAFETLAARERAWRELGAIEGNASLREIAIYRCV